MTSYMVVLLVLCVVLSAACILEMGFKDFMKAGMGFGAVLALNEFIKAALS